MKNIAYTTTSDVYVVPQRKSFVSRWGSMPLMILLLAAGMPLRYELEESKQIFIEDVASATQAALSSAQSLNSLPFTIFMVSIYLFAFGVLIHKPKAAVGMLKRQWPMLALLLLVGLSVLWSFNKDKVVINFVHTAGEVAIALAAALRYRNEPWLLPKHIGYAMGINIALQIGAVLVIPSMAIDWYGRWTGMTTQPNTLGAMALFTFWANAAVILCRRTPDKFHIHFIMAALAVAAMIGANSVTSMLCAVCSLAMLYMFSRYDNAGRIKPRMYVIASTAILLIVTAAVLIMTDSIDLNRLFGLAGRSGDLTGRTEIWLAGAKAVAENPLLGWGFDDNAYVIKKIALPYVSFHSGYLDIALRGGMVAVGLFLILLAKWAHDIRRPSRIGYELIPVSVAFVVAMLLHNLTEAWLVGPRNHIWTIFMALIFLGSCKRWVTTPPAVFGLNHPFYGRQSTA